MTNTWGNRGYVWNPTSSAQGCRTMWQCERLVGAGFGISDAGLIEYRDCGKASRDCDSASASRMGKEVV